MRDILAYLKPHAGRMTLGFVIKFIGTIMDLFLPWILAYLIDEVVPLRSVPLILLWGGAMVVCSVIALVGNIVANRMASRVARDTTESIRHDLYKKTAYLSARQMDWFTVPSLESRLTSDTYNVHQMIGMMQRLGVRAPILLLGGVLVTLTLEPVLTLVLVSTLPLIGIVVYLVSKKGIPMYTKLQQAVDSMVRTVRENVSGIRVIKALSKSEYEKQRFTKVNRDVVARDTKAGITMAVTNPVMNLFLNLGLTLVVIVGAFRVNAGVSQPGKIIAFMTYFIIILNAMLMVTRMFVMVSKGSASAGRISEVLNAGEDLSIQPLSRAGEAHVEFQNVSFCLSQKRDGHGDFLLPETGGDAGDHRRHRQRKEHDHKSVDAPVRCEQRSGAHRGSGRKKHPVRGTPPDVRGGVSKRLSDGGHHRRQY